MSAVQDAGLRRRLAVAHDYPMMMGLVSVMLGVWAIVTAATGVAMFAAIGAMCAGGVVAWYNGRYGTLQPGVRGQLIVTLGAIAAAVAAMALMLLDYYLHLRVLVMPLVVALLLAALYHYGLRHVGMTVWHWLALALLALSSLLPLTGWRNLWPQELGLLGIPLVIVGIVDHLRLVHAFGRGATGREGER